MHVLPIGRGSFESCLRSGEAGVVWPAWDASVSSALETIAAVFGRRAVETPGVEIGERMAASSAETVGAWTRSLRPHAAVYAHLTRRGVDPRHGWDLLGASPFPSVVIVAMEDVTVDFLERVWEASRAGPIGIVTGSSEEELRRQIVLRSAAAALAPGPAATQLVDVLGEAERVGVVSTGGRVTVGAGAGAARTRELVEACPAVLQVAGHSDGLDTRLGGRGSRAVALCPEPHLSGVVSGSPPNCAVTRHCRRLGVPIVPGVPLEGTISVDRLSARIVALLVCTGFAPPGMSVDHRWSQGARLLASARVGCLITSWDMLFTSGADTEDMVLRLALGATGGEAVQEFRKSDAAESGRLRLVLFGDPRTRAVERAASRAPGPEFTRRIFDAPFAMAGASSRTFLEAVIGAASGRGKPDRWALSLAGARGAAGALAAGEAEPERRRRAGDAVAEHLGLLLLSTPWILKTWIAFYNPPDSRTERDAECFQCGRGAKCFRARPIVPGLGDRRVVVCAHCGGIEDGRREGAGPSLAVGSDGVLVIRGAVPPSYLGGVCVVAPPEPAEPLSIPWPRAAGGRLAPSLDAFGGIGDGVVGVRVAFVTEDDVVSLVFWRRAARHAVTGVRARGAGALLADGVAP